MKEAVSTGWYLVYTKPNHENIAYVNLCRQAFEVYFPKLQQHKRRRQTYQVVTEPLFPRYLFIHLNSEVDNWGKIRSTRGCISLVRFGNSPAKIPNKFIEQLKNDEPLRLIAHQNVVSNFFNPGDKVCIIEGVLSDYEGIVELQNSQDRIKLLLNITEGFTRSVTLSIHQVQKAI